MLTLKSITPDLGNVHVCESDFDRARQLLNGNGDVKFELNVQKERVV